MQVRDVVELAFEKGVEGEAGRAGTDAVVDGWFGRTG